MKAITYLLIHPPPFPRRNLAKRKKCEAALRGASFYLELGLDAPPEALWAFAAELQ